MKIILALAALLAFCGAAFAQVEVSPGDFSFHVGPRYHDDWRRSHGWRYWRHPYVHCPRGYYWRHGDCRPIEYDDDD